MQPLFYIRDKGYVNKLVSICNEALLMTCFNSMDYFCSGTWTKKARFFEKGFITPKVYVFATLDCGVCLLFKMTVLRHLRQCQSL